MSAPRAVWSSFDRDPGRPAGGLRAADRARQAIGAVPTAAGEEPDE